MEGGFQGTFNFPKIRSFREEETEGPRRSLQICPRNFFSSLSRGHGRHGLGLGLWVTVNAADTYPGGLSSSLVHFGLLGTLPGKLAGSWDALGVKPAGGLEPAVGPGCWFQPGHVVWPGMPSHLPVPSSACPWERGRQGPLSAR